MDFFDTKDIKSQVYVEPKTNSVVIKIIGFPSKEIAKMYISWLLQCIGFEIGNEEEFTETTIH